MNISPGYIYILYLMYIYDKRRKDGQPGVLCINTNINFLITWMAANNNGNDIQNKTQHTSTLNRCSGDDILLWSLMTDSFVATLNKSWLMLWIKNANITNIFAMMKDIPEHRNSNWLGNDGAMVAKLTGK